MAQKDRLHSVMRFDETKGTRHRSPRGTPEGRGRCRRSRSASARGRGPTPHPRRYFRRVQPAPCCVGATTGRQAAYARGRKTKNASLCFGQSQLLLTWPVRASVLLERLATSGIGGRCDGRQSLRPSPALIAQMCGLGNSILVGSVRGRVLSATDTQTAPFLLWLAPIQCVERKQDLTGLAP